MLIRNVQLFKLVKPITYTPITLASKLEKLAFSPCVPTLPASAGWVSPIEEDYAPLVHAVHGYMLICLQVEAKILPMTVVRQHLKEHLKEIETTQRRKVSTREKFAIKDEIYQSLLPRAFSQKHKLYAYFDTKHHWLILDTANQSRVDLFLDSLKKTLPTVTVVPPKLKKLPTIMTQWLLNGSQPSSIALEKACVLQDFKQQGRMIRCQQQVAMLSSGPSEKVVQSHPLTRSTF